MLRDSLYSCQATPTTKITVDLYKQQVHTKVLKISRLHDKLI